MPGFLDRLWLFSYMKYSVIISPMTPEERSLLERTYAIAEENNKILRGIRSSNRFSMIMRVVYWVVIIIVSFGAYYFIQPYLTMLLGITGQNQGTLQGIENSMNQAQSSANSLKDLLK